MIIKILSEEEIYLSVCLSVYKSYIVYSAPEVLVPTPCFLIISNKILRRHAFKCHTWLFVLFYIAKVIPKKNKDCL